MKKLWRRMPSYVSFPLLAFGVVVVISLTLFASVPSFTVKYLVDLAGGSLIGSGLAYGLLFWAERRDGSRSTPLTVADRIDALQYNLRSSKRLLEEIEAELQVQLVGFERIKAEAENSKHLAALHKEESDAVRRLVDVTVQGAQRQGGRQQWAFFVGGLLVSIPLGVLGNWIYGIITQ